MKIYAYDIINKSVHPWQVIIVADEAGRRLEGWFNSLSTARRVFKKRGISLRKGLSSNWKW